MVLENKLVMKSNFCDLNLIKKFVVANITIMTKSHIAFAKKTSHKPEDVQG